MHKDLEKSLTDFFNTRNTRVYKRGDIIYKPAERIVNIGFVKNGYSRAYRLTPEGQEITFNMFKPIFPITTIYCDTNKISPYYFEAITDVEVWKCPASEFYTYIHSVDGLGSEISSYFAEIIDTLLENVYLTTSGKSDTKCAAIVHSIAKEHGLERDGKLEIGLTMSHRILASLCGISRETTSKMIKRMENLDLIQQTNRKIIVKDMVLLKEIGDGTVSL